jgi:hypothetical protein
MRLLVALLLLANLVFLAWSQGWLDELSGIPADGDREPERLARQVRPETVRVLTPQAVAAAASAADARRVCLEAGPFDAPSLLAAESALSTTLPGGSWSRHAVDTGARWAVVMGRFPNREAQLRKEQELTRLRVPFEPLRGVPDLEPALALGRYAQREAAEAALAQLTQRGIQTARVAELPAPPASVMLRVERADPDLAAKVSGLRLDALGKGFTPCARSS